MLDFIVRDRRLRWPIAANLEAAVRDQTVRAIDRRAKYILIRFDAGTLILHLGMSGSLRLVKAETPLRTHDHWDMRMEGGWVLRFHDPRRFGSLHWTETDIWAYTRREGIPIIPLYLAQEGMRYRSLGDADITSPVPSRARSIDEIIAELDTTRTPERAGRAMDHEAEDAFERLRVAGYL